MANSTKRYHYLPGTRSVASFAAAALFAMATSAGAASNSQAGNGDTAPGPAAMAFDLALARPVGLAATVLGTAVFVVGLPFEALSGDFSDPARRLVVEPAKFTFTRKLGVMEGQ
jgi:hypothetical protein